MVIYFLYSEFQKESKSLDKVPSFFDLQEGFLELELVNFNSSDVFSVVVCFYVFCRGERVSQGRQCFVCVWEE